MKHLLVMPAWLGAFVLLAAAPAFARPDPPTPDLDALVKKLSADAPADALPACFALDALLRAGDKTAEDAAVKVLAAKDQWVKAKDVSLLLSDDLGKKPVLAARLAVAVARAQKMVAQFKKGAVAVGQVVVEDGKTDPQDVMAQMPILPDGYFAGEVGDLKRPLSFRAHGYGALDVPLDGRSGELVYVGKVVLKPLKREDAAALKGTIVLDGEKGPDNATVTLTIGVGPINTPHNGYSPRPHWPAGITVPITKSGEFAVGGLTPAAYYLSVKADGHVAYNQTLQFEPGKEKDAGEIRLRAMDVGVYIGKAAPKADKLSWEKDYAAALARAKEEKKPILVMETATWCGWCKKLEADTLDDPWVRYALSDYVVVKAFEDKEVEGKYGCDGYPTLVFTDSAGKMARKSVGYMAVLPFLEQIARADQKLGAPLPAELQTLADKKLITLDGAPAGTRAAPEVDKNDKELKWAKGVAEDFLTALHKNDEGQATLLMNKQMAGAVQADGNWFNKLSNAGFIRGESSSTIAEEELAPDKDEAVFRGRLDGRSGETPVQSKFTIRLIKDKESGKWRVGFFTFTDPAPVDKKP